MNKRFQQPLRALLLILLAGVPTLSCSSFGGKKLISSHTSYNDSVQLTVTREVLTNIVRSRYADPMQFITVQSINAQFSVGAGASVGVGGVGGGAASGEAEGSIGYSNSPTITFAPEVGSAYFESLYGPLTITELVAFIIQNRYFPAGPDWTSTSLKLIFSSVNDTSDIVGGAPNPVYFQRIDAISQLLDSGASLRQVAEWDKHPSTISKEKVLGEDMVEAGKAGLYWLDEENGTSARLAKRRMALALDVTSAEEQAATIALRDLDLEPGSERYFVRSPVDAKPDKPYPNSIWLTPRSLVEVFMVTGSFVDVPAEHQELVPQRIRPFSTDVQAAALRIRSARQCPSVPYRVMHRGFCFYVDDTDVGTKMILEGLVSVYMSRVGGVSGRRAEPQVVIPLG